MERRVLLAIILSFLVLYTYQAFFVKPLPKPKTAAAGAAVQPSAAPGEPAAAASVPAPSSSEASIAAPTAAPLVGDTSEREVRLENPHVAAVFTNRGGRLKSWKLKDYHDAKGEPLELVSTQFGSSQPLPFTLTVPDAATSKALNDSFYAISRSSDASGSPGDVAFEYRDNAGLQVRKHFQLSPQTFTLTFDSAVSQNDRALAPTIVWGPGLGDSDSQTGRAAVKPGALFSSAGKISRLASSSVTTTPQYDQEFEYAGIDDHYFLAVALKPGRVKAVYQPLTVPPPAGTKETARDFMSFAIDQPSPKPLTYYVGPKDFDTLAAVDRDLTKAINFGMFSVLVVPLLRALNWIHSYVGNYGWAIFLLTIFINVVLFPLNHKSVVSMRKMQEIQPETKAIQDRYAKLKTTDPARAKMNEELMALYRERGVNPASGCVPILLTLPVFLAFYALLTTAIELRGAPFIGWIHDLSQPDPYYVLPVLVGASQIVMQWMTPQAGADPTQQKMMMIMPVILIFAFISAPTGALIYWLVGNVWRLGQQQLTNYLIGPPNIRTIRPAAERRVKRVGGGKTDGAAREPARDAKDPAPTR